MSGCPFCDDSCNTNKQFCYACGEELIPADIFNMEFLDSNYGFKRSYIGMVKDLDGCINADRELLDWIYDSNVGDEYLQYKKIKDCLYK